MNHLGVLYRAEQTNKTSFPRMVEGTKISILDGELTFGNALVRSSQWRTEGGGSNPSPRNSEGSRKSCQTQPDCENC